jgi:ribosomal protein L24
MEFPIDASNVLLFSDKLERGTRTKSAVVDGKRVRIGVKCGTNFG